MHGTIEHHLHDPIMAGMDILSGAAVIGYWFDLLAHPIGVFSTLMAGLWWAFCLYDGISRRIEGNRERRKDDD